jgi:hypothetical protein
MGIAVAVIRDRCGIGGFTAATRAGRLVIDLLDQEGARDD